jgi:hypothetical protein
VAVSVLPFANAAPNTSHASILWLAPKSNKPHKSRRTHKLTLWLVSAAGFDSLPLA